MYNAHTGDRMAVVVRSVLRPDCWMWFKSSTRIVSGDFGFWIGLDDDATDSRLPNGALKDAGIFSLLRAGIGGGMGGGTGGGAGGGTGTLDTIITGACGGVVGGVMTA